MEYIKKFKDFINETNEDGTISKDEPKRTKKLLQLVEKDIDRMISDINEEANKIGGPYRSPAIRDEVYKMLKDKINKLK